MIQLHRPPKPPELTDDLVAKLTAEFKADKNKTVWNKPFIRKALLEMSHGKCCYCECHIDRSGLMHVDHFLPKAKYPDLVVDWENLLPSCHHCNTNKHEHDAHEEPLVHPVHDRPQEFFYLKNYRYRSKNDKARVTIQTLALNDSTDKVQERFRMGELLQHKLQGIYELAVAFQQSNKRTARERNKIYNGCRDILRFGLAESEYAAFMATAIHQDSTYHDLRKILQMLGLWSEELENLHTASKMNVFDDHR